MHMEWDPAEDQQTPMTPIKGRGAISNPHNRFDTRTCEPVDDGWRVNEDDEPAPKTILLKEISKTIISTNNSPDIPFDQSINPYRGCEHGCIYCYARPSHAYWDLSPGLDFETKIITKPNAAKLLREKLSQPGYVPKSLCIGANTDPYQPAELKLGITRSIIEVLAEFEHPFSIITKSNQILRDLDLLVPLAEKNLCSVAVSVTTLDNNLKRILEPRTPSGRVRLEAIESLASANISVTLLVAPVIPCINDHELESILVAGKEAGAVSSRYILLRLPREVAVMFREWLSVHFPERANKVMNIIRQSRGGLDYRSVFGERMTGTGHFADLIHSRWQITAKKLGFEESDTQLDFSKFKKINEQLTLF